jgi:hypothetical protein
MSDVQLKTEIEMLKVVFCIWCAEIIEEKVRPLFRVGYS